MASAVDGTKKVIKVLVYFSIDDHASILTLQSNIGESKKKGKISSSNEETLSAIEKGALAGKDPEKANYVVELLKQLQVGDSRCCMTRSYAMTHVRHCSHLVLSLIPLF